MSGEATTWRTPGKGSPVRVLLRELLVAGELHCDVAITSKQADQRTALAVERPHEFGALDVMRAREALKDVGVPLPAVAVGALVEGHVVQRGDLFKPLGRTDDACYRKARVGGQ